VTERPPSSLAARDRVLWEGQLTTHRRLRLRGLLQVLPGAAWLVIFLVLPSVVLVALAFARNALYGQFEWAFSFENFTRMLGLSSAEAGDYLRIVWRSIWVGAMTTVLSIALAYPLAFFIARRPQRQRYLLLALVMVPFATNIVVRVYALMILFSKDLPPAKIASALGLVDPNTSLYPSAFAVYVGMISCYLPFAILPIYTNVEKLDWSLVEAAQDLYGGTWRVFRHAILPQTRPGLSAAVILTFIPSMGTFVITDLLSGAKYWLVGNLIQQQFGPGKNLPFGAALSVALMILTLVPLLLLRRRSKREVRP